MNLAKDTHHPHTSDDRQSKNKSVLSQWMHIDKSILDSQLEILLNIEICQYTQRIYLLHLVASVVAH